MKTKEIYSKRVAFELRRKGFDIIEVGINPYRPDLRTFIFEETEEFTEAFSAVMISSKTK